jgi:hypothetical protein
MRNTLLLTILSAAATASLAPAALRVIETVPTPDLDVDETGTLTTVEFTSSAVDGVGIEATWTAVVADNANGTAPWSIDLGVNITSPSGTLTSWEPIGGEVSIADYPLQDAEPLAAPGGSGTYDLEFTSVSGPWVAGLRDVTLYALEQVPDVVEVRQGTTAGGPMWDRPFSIAGVSGLGPVSYHALEFTVSESGLYIFESVLDSGEDHWTSLYENGFDPEQPLANQLDYGLGNGFASNGSPRGTALIESLLIEGRAYTLVTSQWASFRTPGPWTLTITGPAAIVESGACPTDLDADGSTTAADLAQLIAQWGTAGAADFDASGATGPEDLATLIAAWGPCP